MTLSYKCKSCSWSGGVFNNATSARNDHEHFSIVFGTLCGSWHPVCEEVKREKTVAERLREIDENKPKPLNSADSADNSTLWNHCF